MLISVKPVQNLKSIVEFLPLIIQEVLSMTFDEFIKHETKDEKELSEQKRIMLEEWQNNLNKLYDTVRDFLKEYIKTGKVKITEEDIDITEELLGTYTAKKMVIHLGNLGKYVELTPVGKYVIAAYGRVDMSGKNGTVRIVLVDSKLDRPHIVVTLPDDIDVVIHERHEIPKTKPVLAWRFVTAPPNIKYIPIEREIFLEQLMQLS